MIDSQPQDIRDFLNDCIKSIKKSYPNLSSVQIAKKLNISNSTFSRFENKDVKKPSFGNALQIAREACGESRVQDFIAKYYPEMLEKFKITYTGNSDADFVPVEAEAFFEDSTSYEIMMLVSSNSRLTKEMVSIEFGKRGLMTLENLVSKEILKVNNGIYFLGTKINARQPTVKKLFENLVHANYKLDKFGTQTNWLSLQYESVDANLVLPQIREVYLKANQDIRNIFNDSKNSGNDLIWAGMVMDSLLTKNCESTGVIQ